MAEKQREGAIKEELVDIAVDEDVSMAEDLSPQDLAPPGNDVETTAAPAPTHIHDDAKDNENEDSSDNDGIVMSLSKEQQKAEEEANAYLAKQTFPVIIPSFSAWFKFNKIHPIEKKSFPEYFYYETNNDGSNGNNRMNGNPINNKLRKDPKIYRDFRNFIINTYRINPIEYLSFTAVRRNLSSDVQSIYKIYKFLNKWGLINYQIDPKTKPFVLNPQFTGHFQITLDTPDSIQPFIQKSNNNNHINKNKNKNKKLKKLQNHNDIDIDIDNNKIDNEIDNEINKNNITKEKENSNDSNFHIPLNLEIRKNVYDSISNSIVLDDSPLLNNNTNNNNNNNQIVNSNINNLNLNNPADINNTEFLKKVYICNICGNNTTEIRYHSLRSPNSLILCSTCFNQGFFPQNFFSSDFIKINSNNLKLSNYDPWDENEIILLLEGIKIYDDDWDKIAKHVSSRNKQQCLEFFIKLPIEDNYLSKYLNKQNNLKNQNDNNNKHPINNKITNNDIDNDIDNDINNDDNNDNDNRTYAINSLKFLVNKIDSNLAKKITDQDTNVKNNEDDGISEKLMKMLNINSKNEKINEIKESYNTLNLLVDLQLKKIDLKLKNLSNFEKILNIEKLNIQNEKKKIFLDKLALRNQILNVKDKMINSTKLLSLSINDSIKNQNLTNQNSNSNSNSNSISKSNEALKLIEEAIEDSKKPIRAFIIHNDKLHNNTEDSMMLKFQQTINSNYTCFSASSKIV
ncbi:Rsc8p [Ascoidea rubescens DSM 1968]|uniref:SWIRM-domain-containing protein n=1 Tax=Ascoidea rubescens DSM 1968 TaxID=1344418 RepID=A0A1D2VAT0_9ASCO|nr:SWIRM-domain-containing protein [Ascoidea rubescens DSM 1968]ODV58804.1 SWIRM-domain-containing protein [Ascoidea rubescens DSM 1968]